MKMRRNDYTKKIRKLQKSLEELGRDLDESVEARDCAEKVRTVGDPDKMECLRRHSDWCIHHRPVVLAVLDDRRRSIEKRILAHEHKIQEAQGLRALRS